MKTSVVDSDIQKDLCCILQYSGIPLKSTIVYRSTLTSTVIYIMTSELYCIIQKSMKPTVV